MKKTMHAKLPWYLSTVFISLCMMFSIFIIPFIGGIILIIFQQRTLKRIIEKANSITDTDLYKTEIENKMRTAMDENNNKISALRKKAEEDVSNKLKSTEDEISALRKKAEEDVSNKLKSTEDEISALRKKAEEEISNQRAEAKNTLEDINSEIERNTTTLKRLNNSVERSQRELNDIVKDVLIEYVSPYIFDVNISSEEYKNKLSVLRVQQNEFMKSDKCIKYHSESRDFLKRTLNNNVKQLLRCFNSESSNIISHVTINNIDTCRNKLQKTFEILNKIFSTDGVELNKKCLELKLDELTLLYNYQLRLMQEKEILEAEKEQIRENAKAERELALAEAKIEKEETQFKNEINKLMAYMQKSSDIEKQLYIDKIKELEDKLKNLEKDKENIMQRKQNTAGFVYVISNIGSFGENIYKIGMTRRLEPLDRIKELSSASVPFEFDVHALIFSDNAPELENILHKTFAKNAVNKVNPRKEFYNIDLNEIQDVVKNNHNATVNFTEYAKAEQYRESLRLAQVE